MKRNITLALMLLAFSLVYADGPDDYSETVVSARVLCISSFRDSTGSIEYRQKYMNMDVHGNSLDEVGGACFVEYKGSRIVAISNCYLCFGEEFINVSHYKRCARLYRKCNLSKGTVEEIYIFFNLKVDGNDSWLSLK